jgi:serine protease Do
MQNPRRLLAAMALSLALFTIAFGQVEPKKNYKLGEQLIKQGKTVEAYLAIKEAVSLEPTNTKFQKKLLEVGKLASAKAVLEAKKFVVEGSSEAIKWLQLATEADSSNAEAAQLLSQVQQDISGAKVNLQAVKVALNGGDLQRAKSLLSEITKYTDSIAEFKSVSNEVAFAEAAKHAVGLWEAGNADKALEEIGRVETQGPDSVYIRNVSTKLRREISERVAADAKALPSHNVDELLAKLNKAERATNIDPSNEKAAELEAQSSSFLLDALLSMNAATSVSPSKSGRRVALERLTWAETIMPGNRRLLDEKGKLEESIYPVVSISISAASPSNCPETVSHDYILGSAADALKVFFKEDNRAPDFVLTVKDIICSTTDVPRQNVRPINSTYVAGYNQLANPDYVNIEQRLQAAQIELNRAMFNNSLNPNFGTAFALGMARGKVNNLQATLRKTPPYIQQPITQQYQYENYEAYRAFHIDATVQLIGKVGNKQYIDESKVTYLSDKRETGLSGVLPSDTTGARNAEARMPLQETLAKNTVEGFKNELSKGVKDTLGGYFAFRAMEKGEDDDERLASLLYLADISEGTKFNSQIRELKPKVGESLLHGRDGIRPFVASLNLPLSERAQFSENISPVAAAPEVVISKAMEGVVSVETNNGSGSGFFVNSACLVITNAHVVSGAETIIVRNAAKRLNTAEVVAIDDERDLALLRSNARTCTPVPLTDSTNSKIGQDVYAIGSPLGLSGTVTKGIISSLRATSSGVQLIQLDAALNPGNSGGPLINQSGQVIGVTTFKLKGFENLNFAVTSNEVKKAFSILLR